MYDNKEDAIKYLEVIRNYDKDVYGNLYDFDGRTMDKYDLNNGNKPIKDKVLQMRKIIEYNFLRSNYLKAILPFYRTSNHRVDFEWKMISRILEHYINHKEEMR